MEILKRYFSIAVMVVMIFQLFVVNSVMAATPGSVVINEIAWMGSLDNSNDEWIELYNPTSQPIDLSGWSLEDDGVATTIESGVIAPYSYFLIEDAEAVTDEQSDALISLSLANTGDSLVLKDETGTVVDSVNESGGAWYAGDSTFKATMERIDPENLVDDAGNFATAVSGNGALASGGSAILGTPGSVNSNYSGSGPVVTLRAPLTDVYNGDVITVTTEVDAVTDLYSYGFEINYDPNVLAFISATEGTLLNGDASATAFNVALEGGAEGSLIVGNTRLVNPAVGIDGSGELFSLQFKVMGLSGANSFLTFDGTSFISNSVGDILASMNGATVNVGDSTANPVENLGVDLGIDQYSLELSWSAPITGADSYLIQRKDPNGAYLTIGNVADIFFVDNNNLIPNIVYEYQVIAVKNGNQSTGVEATGIETRGLRGDTDRSGRVDGRDLDRLARSFGSVIGDSDFDSLKDTNYDGIIDGSDLIDIGINFGLVY